VEQINSIIEDLEQKKREFIKENPDFNKKKDYFDNPDLIKLFSKINSV
jgi:flagellar biosynthesis/type III secretory pathway chaperone